MVHKELLVLLEMYAQPNNSLPLPENLPRIPVNVTAHCTKLRFAESFPCTFGEKYVRKHDYSFKDDELCRSVLYSISSKILNNLYKFNCFLKKIAVSYILIMQQAYKIVENVMIKHNAKILLLFYY